jgi:hypothetical protein
VKKAVLDHRRLRTHPHDLVGLWLVAGDGVQAQLATSSWISWVPEVVEAAVEGVVEPVVRRLALVCDSASSGFKGSRCARLEFAERLRREARDIAAQQYRAPARVISEHVLVGI